jgi:ketosteroid isomerase-like protein
MRFWPRARSSAPRSNELPDLGGDEVFVAAEITVKYKGSGMTLTEPRFNVLTLRDGLIVRMNAYRDRKEALEAAGLAE